MLGFSALVSSIALLVAASCASIMSFLGDSVRVSAKAVNELAKKLQSICKRLFSFESPINSIN